MKTAFIVFGWFLVIVLFTGSMLRAQVPVKQPEKKVVVLNDTDKSAILLLQRNIVAQQKHFDDLKIDEDSTNQVIQSLAQQLNKKLDDLRITYKLDKDAFFNQETTQFEVTEKK